MFYFIVRVDGYFVVFFITTYLSYNTLKNQKFICNILQFIEVGSTAQDGVVPVFTTGNSQCSYLFDNHDKYH